MKCIALLALIIVFSGCVFQGGSNVTSDAIVVNDFSADPAVAEADDVVTFFLDIENTGGTTARCITSELYGIETWYDANGNPMSYGGSWTTGGLGFAYGNNGISFNYNDPSRGYVNFNYDRDYGMSLSSFVGNAWNQFSSQFCNAAGGWTQYSDIKYFDSMKPAVPSQGKPGQSFTTQWLMRPPKLREGVHASYPITARTTYSYTSNAVVNLQAYNKAEYERRRILGEPLELPLSVDTSYASPIEIVPVRGINPIVVNQRQYDNGPELANYLFEFRNVGSGWPLPLDSDAYGQNGFIFATVELDGPGAYFYDCLGATSGTEAFVYGDAIRNLVKLRSDKTAPFGCTIAVDRNEWVDNPLGTISLTFNLWYRYYTDANTVVEVVGPQDLY